LTYREVGATAGDMPDGYQHLTRRVVLGHGHQLFTRAGDAVLQWQVQVRAGLRVSVSSPVATPGAALILGLGIGPVRVKAPGRVVYVVDEPRRRGFAYGTLPGHPESGEAAHLVFVAKCWRGVLTAEHITHLRDVFTEACGNFGATLVKRPERRVLGRQVSGQSPGRPRICRRSRKSVIV